MSYLLVVIKGKRQLLVMPEYLIAHIPFYPGPHDMPVIGNIKVTERLHQYQNHHEDSQLHDQIRCLLHRLVHNRVGNITYNKRYYKGDSGP